MPDQSNLPDEVTLTPNRLGEAVLFVLVSVLVPFALDIEDWFRRAVLLVCMGAVLIGAIFFVELSSLALDRRGLTLRCLGIRRFYRWSDIESVRVSALGSSKEIARNEVVLLRLVDGAEHCVSPRVAGLPASDLAHLLEEWLEATASQRRSEVDGRETKHGASPGKQPGKRVGMIASQALLYLAAALVLWEATHNLIASLLAPPVAFFLLDLLIGQRLREYLASPAEDDPQQ